MFSELIRPLIFGLTGIFCAVQTLAQIELPLPLTFIPISNGGMETVDCDATETIFFTDDNNGGSSFQTPYTNQNYSITLCPDAPGEALQLNFLLFSLETGLSPDGSDVLYVYDGDNNGAPLIGEGVGNSFQGLTITASDLNASGCLTMEFVVNSGAFAGNQGWVAEIKCGTPCAYPIADLTIVSPDPLVSDPGLVGLCIDEEVVFDASGSMPGGAGVSLDSVIWNWGDGTIQATAVEEGLVQSHVYSIPGLYEVSLVVKDEASCSSTNQETLDVAASTLPVFNTLVSSPLCVNEPGILDGTPVASAPWIVPPIFGVSENASLPDATGVTFESQLVIDVFEPGQTLEDCSHLELITANIEHSFVGDLTMSVTCPNGTTVVLMENSLTSGTAGPDPNDCNLNASGTGEDLNSYALGASVNVGFDYSWNMDAQYILDGIDNPFTDDNPPIILPDGTVIQSGRILSETYLPCGNFCDFVGCPLNGTWTFNVLDQWASDDGTLFGWSMEFHPDIAPDITTFLPTIGMGSDSSFWHPVGDPDNILTSADDGVEAVSSDGNIVDVLFETPGMYEFGYQAVNSYGCSADTTVVIEVIANSNEILSAGPDLRFCGEPIQLQGSFQTEASQDCQLASGIYQHCYDSNEDTIFNFCPDNLGDGTMMVLNFLNGTLELGEDFVTVFDGPDATGSVLAILTGTVAGESFVATNSTGCLSFQLASNGNCSCQESEACDIASLQWCTHCGDVPGNCNFNFDWQPSIDLDDSSLLQPTLLSFDGDSMAFILTMTSAEFDVCAMSDTMIVYSGFDYDVLVEQTSCDGDDGEILVDILSAPIESDLPFLISLFESISDTLIEELVWVEDVVTFEGLVPGEYEIQLSNAAGCSFTEMATIFVPDTVLDAGDVLDYIEVHLEASPVLFEGAVGLPNEVIYSNGESFPIQDWIERDSMELFIWDDGIVDAVAIEGCTDAFVRIVRDVDQSNQLDLVELTWSGSASWGVDFSTNAQVVELMPGVTEYVIPLSIDSDSLQEGVEDVVVEYEYVDACGGNVSNDSRLIIIDPIPIDAGAALATCLNGLGSQAVEFLDIQGFGPFSYQWGEAPLPLMDDWIELDSASVIEIIDALNPEGELLSSQTFELALQDQCGQVSSFDFTTQLPLVLDQLFCVDTTVPFPGINLDMPVLDLLVDGQSLLDSSILFLNDTLEIDATWLDGFWLLGEVTTGGDDWAGEVTLVDTCGQAVTAEWHILEYPCTEGCTIEEACNYIGDAGIEDGSCEFPGDDCDDGDASTEGEILNEDCECAVPIDGTSEMNLEFSIAPNPSTGRVRVKTNVRQGTIRCYSMDGRVLFETQKNDCHLGVELDLSQGSGIYLLEFSSGEFKSTKRMVVQH